MSIDHFAHKADSYEQDKARVDNVAQIASAVQQKIKLAPDMQLMDFGAGTGLLLERIAPHVGRITAVDASPAMTAQLRAKLDHLGCPVDILEMDLEKSSPSKSFDGIMSSMTLHHIKDVPALLAKLFGLLHDDGFLAIADLEKEDGTFHAENTGVHHDGFVPDDLVRVARAQGFRDVEVSTVSAIHKGDRRYPIFLLTARR